MLLLSIYKQRTGSLVLRERKYIFEETLRLDYEGENSKFYSDFLIYDVNFRYYFDFLS